MNQTLKYIENAVREVVLPNRRPLTPEQKKAMYAKGRGLGGGTPGSRRPPAPKGQQKMVPGRESPWWPTPGQQPGAKPLPHQLGRNERDIMYGGGSRYFNERTGRYEGPPGYMPGQPGTMMPGGPGLAVPTIPQPNNPFPYQGEWFRRDPNNPGRAILLPPELQEEYTRKAREAWDRQHNPQPSSPKPKPKVGDLWDGSSGQRPPQGFKLEGGKLKADPAQLFSGMKWEENRMANGEATYRVTMPNGEQFMMHQNNLNDYANNFGAYVPWRDLGSIGGGATPPRRGSIPGYGTPPGNRGQPRTGDFRDRDGDGVDDRDQDGPGMPRYGTPASGRMPGRRDNVMELRQAPPSARPIGPPDLSKINVNQNDPVGQWRLEQTKIRYGQSDAQPQTLQEWLKSQRQQPNQIQQRPLTPAGSGGAFEADMQRAANEGRDWQRNAYYASSKYMTERDARQRDNERRIQEMIASSDRTTAPRPARPGAAVIPTFSGLNAARNAEAWIASQQRQQIPGITTSPTEPYYNQVRREAAAREMATRNMADIMRRNYQAEEQRSQREAMDQFKRQNPLPDGVAVGIPRGR